MGLGSEREKAYGQPACLHRLWAAMAGAHGHGCKEYAAQGLCLMVSDSVWPDEIKVCEYGTH